MSQVPATRTPITDTDLLASLHLACTTVLSSVPSDATLAILCAQVALETGHMVSLVQFNLGNYKRGPGPDWCEFQTFEYFGSPPVKTSVVGQFSAWPDLNSAAAFYLDAFAKHWPEAWAGALAGDADAFCSGLKRRGYYTAPETLYAAGVKRWQAYYLARLAGDHETTQPDLEDLGAATVVTLPVHPDDPPPDAA